MMMKKMMLTLEKVVNNLYNIQIVTGAKKSEFGQDSDNSDEEESAEDEASNSEDEYFSDDSDTSSSNETVGQFIYIDVSLEP